MGTQVELPEQHQKPGRVIVVGVAPIYMGPSSTIESSLLDALRRCGVPHRAALFEKGLTFLCPAHAKRLRYVRRRPGAQDIQVEDLELGIADRLLTKCEHLTEASEISRKPGTGLFTVRPRFPVEYLSVVNTSVTLLESAMPAHAKTLSLTFRTGSANDGDYPNECDPASHFLYQPTAPQPLGHYRPVRE